MTLVLRSAVVSDVGLRRRKNEDSAHAGRWLIAVADGVGGAPAGEVASDLAIQALVPLDRAAPGDPLAVLRSAVDEANQRVGAAAEADDRHGGMGTTVTALLLRGGRIALVHVGDSRAYRLRDGTLDQLTRDDTLVQALVDSGVLTVDEAREHPQRSLVTQAVQGGPVTAAATVFTPRPADRYLVCSDGLSDLVADDVIAQALRGYPEPRECAEQLVKLTVQAGAPDNVTVVVADVAAAD